MDSEEIGAKELLSQKYIVGVLLAILILIFALLFVFRDFGDVSKEADQGLEETQERQTQVGEEPSLDDYFEKEFAEERDAQTREEPSDVSSEGTCTIDGQSVKDGTVVSGSTCSAPPQEE